MQTALVFLCLLIPETYDPLKKYPVEFMLHGGVSRPECEPGGGWWRRGFDSLKRDDRIVVVPASWNEAFGMRTMIIYPLSSMF